MVSVAVLTSPNDGRAPDSVPRRVFDDFPDIEIEVESVVPLDSSAIPYVWIREAETTAIERVVGDYREVTDISCVEAVDGGGLFRVEWDIDSPVFQCIHDASGSLMDARGDADRWRLTVWFETGADAGEFMECIGGFDVPVTVERINAIDEVAEGTQPAVTPAQREALVTAHEYGYFEQPREVTQTELADYLDISAAAVGTRLRRGTANMVERRLNR